MTRIFSGIRPSGKLHLGNYLGAIKNWIELQEKTSSFAESDSATVDKDEVIFGIVDYHAITTPYEPKKFKEQVFDTACEFLAAGINPEKSLLIRQSKVPQHTELAWLFNTITPVSWLERLPTYKEKLKESPKYNHMGLLDYPVLMAADILIYKANLVPVGEDQLPHIDLTNEIARKFNHMFEETFEPVKAHIAEGARIMSLQEPTKKMSKTGDEGIALTDSPDEIRKKIKKAVTDSDKEIIFSEKEKPAISNLLTTYHLLSGKSVKDLEKEYKGKSYEEFKNDLAEVVVNFLKPLREKYEELRKNQDYVVSILTKSEENAKNIAESNLTTIKERMGFI